MPCLGSNVPYCYWEAAVKLMLTSLQRKMYIETMTSSCCHVQVVLQNQSSWEITAVSWNQLKIPKSQLTGDEEQVSTGHFQV